MSLLGESRLGAVSYSVHTHGLSLRRPHTCALWAHTWQSRVVTPLQQHRGPEGWDESSWPEASEWRTWGSPTAQSTPASTERPGRGCRCTTDRLGPRVRNRGRRRRRASQQRACGASCLFRSDCRPSCLEPRHPQPRWDWCEGSRALMLRD